VKLNYTRTTAVRKQVGTQRQSYTPAGLRIGLYNTLFAPTPRVVKPETKKVHRRKVSDEDLALIRGDVEIRKMSRKDVMEKWGISRSQFASYTGYLTGLHIDPK
jgi:hypothetical protein